MSVQLHDLVRKVKAQASRNLNGESLVVLTERRQLHRLNTVGTRVWEICDERRVADIVDVIVSEFEVESAAAQSDVCEFLQHLHELGAVEIESRHATPPAEAEA
jgi:acetolactate synthase small subunit